MGRPIMVQYDQIISYSGGQGGASNSSSSNSSLQMLGNCEEIERVKARIRTCPGALQHHNLEFKGKVVEFKL